jgi:hypothetical protein
MNFSPSRADDAPHLPSPEVSPAANLKLALQPASSSPTADLEHVRRGLFASYLRREPVFQGGFSRAAKQHTRRNDTAEVVAATSSSLL